MINKKEITLVIILALIIGFLINLGNSPIMIIIGFFSILMIFLINIIAKKITAYSLDSKIDIDLWQINRYGFKPHNYVKKPFQAGILFPLISKIIFFPLQNFVWMASLVFESKPLVYRASKRIGLYSFSEMTEYHTGLIAASGIVANLFFAFLAYIIGFPSEMNFIELSIIFSFFNMLPFSDLDGNKIFFGSHIIWTILFTITLLSLIGTFIIV